MEEEYQPSKSIRNKVELIYLYLTARWRNELKDPQALVFVCLVTERHQRRPETQNLGIMRFFCFSICTLRPTPSSTPASDHISFQVSLTSAREIGVQ